jgi:hypothetical protein
MDMFFAMVVVMCVVVLATIMDQVTPLSFTDVMLMGILWGVVQMDFRGDRET